MFGPEASDVRADFGIVPVPLEKFTRPGPRIPEQRLVDELDGRSRPLDVQDDGPDVLLQLEAVRNGMYVGPMQSGW